MDEIHHEEDWIHEGLETRGLEIFQSPNFGVPWIPSFWPVQEVINLLWTLKH